MVEGCSIGTSKLEKTEQTEAMLFLGPGRGCMLPSFSYNTEFRQLLATAVCTTTGKRLIQTSKTLFALLKVINHCAHRGLLP